MKTRATLISLTLLIGVTVLQPMAAAEVTLKVVDQYNKPLKGVVIELPNSPRALGANLPVAVVDQVDKRFVPDLKLIQAGQRVSFPNSDNIRHHVYSFSPAKPFELKLYAGKPESPIAFDQPGVVVLGCNIHDSMVGYIYVAEGEAFTTDHTGIANIPIVPPPTQVFIWHARQTQGPEQRELRKLTQQKGEHLLILPIQPATPRDTFREKFKASASQ